MTAVSCSGVGRSGSSGAEFEAGTGRRIAGGINLVRSAAGGIKDLTKTWSTKERPPEEDVKAVQACVNELLIQLGAVASSALALVEENARLREALATTSAKADLRAKRRAKGHGYTLDRPPPGYDEGPYCTGCWDSKDQLVLLHGMPAMEGGGSRCPSCRQEYKRSLNPAGDD